MIECLYKASAMLSAIVMNTGYHIHYEGKFPDKPFVLCGKHQSGLDIVLMGHHLLKQGKVGRFFMRRMPYVNNILEKVYGGTTIVRPLEIRAGLFTREEGRELNELAKEKSLNYLMNGEIPVIYPEGTRIPGQMGKIRSNMILEYLIEAQEEIGPIPFVAEGNEYTSKEIFFRVGKPFYTDNSKELKEYLEEELPRLSNLNGYTHQ
jgi:1-acyl-sn-glycerol-3-phosphate acyltransferase